MIKVLHYGSGNVKAITNIYKRLNIACGTASTAQELSTASKVIVPGVGAFDQVMTLLEQSGMVDTLNRMVLKDRVPVLGVCVGMQVMAQSSEEGDLDGLGWISGSVKLMDTSGLDHRPKLPHMGWNTIALSRPHSIVEGVDPDKGFYFLHSYRFVCSDEDSVLATSRYGDDFTAAIVSDSIFGFQFHPEKSHANGIAVFRNFARL